MASIRVLSKADVDQVLRQGDVAAAREIVTLMSDTFRSYTLGHETSNNFHAQAPQRIAVNTESHKVLFMPSRLNETTSVKIVSVPTKDGKGGLPATVMVLDEATGSVDTVMNGAALTAVRTAAGSGLATQYYTKEDVKHLVVLGAGAQGRAHIDMMIAVRPSLEHIAIWNRGQERRDQLIEEMRTAYPTRTVVAADDLEKYVREADIICTCTNASEPVLRGAWLRNSVHLNCVGSYRLDMHEVDAQVITRCDKILVDSIEACKAEAGELVKSSKPEDWTEMGQVVKDSHLQSESQQFQGKITLFKSVGISVQDSAIAGLIAERAKEANLGSIIPF
ncbi:uncharacterized protein BYT42DRAFT_493759 [Radiomyces spectabilis]|uniref:uncharacterized protein n=1 Tax=Radiomyces spectabilis TaxID=64574 RepID=UPI00221F65FF|nr:uncharacterized protein BYT42DRAFT_493759 [Radiomyces spectabilis]KAI8385057.1 hypothetical protein BYT42DRAFT_493759 [Radiomyces spectabilis]